jgi:centrosomal protein CEP41
MTQASAVTYATEQLGITEDTRFLLLDLRDTDDFNKWHIKEAVSYPAPNISREKMFP